MPDLPRFAQLAGYNQHASQNRIFNKLENNGERVRRGLSRAIAPKTCVFRLDRDQVFRFERFYREELNDGVRQFSIPDQMRDGQTITTEDGSLWLAEDGTPITVVANWRARISDAGYVIEPAGVTFFLGFTLNVLEVSL